MGPAYAEPSGAVLRILVAAMGAFAGFQVTTATMIGVNRHRQLIPVFAAEALVNLGLSILLVGHLGIVGVAWGTAIPRLVVSLLVGPLYARRVLGVRLRAYYGHALLRPAAAMIPFAVVTHATEAWWPVASVAGFFVQVLVALPVAALGAWAVALNAGERRALAGLVVLPGIARNGVA
jgi:O-antigen/teichoic acid export membrane protein